MTVKTRRDDRRPAGDGGVIDNRAISRQTELVAWQDSRCKRTGYVWTRTIQSNVR